MNAQQTFEILSAARHWGDSVLIRHSKRELHAQVRCCRAVLWYEQLRERVEVHSARGMQSAFAWDSFTKRPGEKRGSSSIWLKYHHGKHLPSAKTLLKVEALRPGSSAVICDPFWSLLIKEHFSHVRAQRLLKQLPEPLRSALFKKDKHGRLQRNTQWERWSGPRNDRDFVQLRAFVILAREAIESGQRLAADKWAYKVFEAFIHLGPMLMRYRVGRALFRVLDHLIFSRTDICLNCDRCIRLGSFPRPSGGHVPEDELENYAFWVDEMSKATCRMIYRDLRASTGPDLTFCETTQKTITKSEEPEPLRLAP